MVTVNSVICIRALDKVPCVPNHSSRRLSFFSEGEKTFDVRLSRVLYYLGCLNRYITGVDSLT